MTDTAVVRTLAELERWRRRRLTVLTMHEGKADLRGELEKVDRQLSYYENLAQEMKREMRPAGLADLLRTFF